MVPWGREGGGFSAETEELRKAATTFYANGTAQGGNEEGEEPLYFEEASQSLPAGREKVLLRRKAGCLLLVICSLLKGFPNFKGQKDKEGINEHRKDSFTLKLDKQLRPSR